MLTEREEQTLKQLARDHTPLAKPSTPLVSPAQPIGDYLAREMEKARKIEPQNPEQDYAVRDRIKHVLRKNEKIMEFFARVGLSRPQILAMGHAEISKFVEQADLRNAAEGLAVPRLHSGNRVQPSVKPAPAKVGKSFLIG